jgi:phosphoribosylglycinamide formyltransferase 1
MAAQTASAINTIATSAKQVRVLVLVSGGGTNLQALLDAERAGQLSDASIVGVISDRPGVKALERAQAAGVGALTEAPDKSLPRQERREELSARILLRARSLKADLIVLAGYLSILQGPILDEYRQRIINLHPALLPKYGGEGMYGNHVHHAVLAAGETESGCTVHYVDSGTDTGAIILQKRVPVLEDDTADSLATRIHTQEHLAMVEAIAKLAKEILSTSTTQE